MHNTLITEHVILRFLSRPRLFLPLSRPFTRTPSPVHRGSFARDRTDRSTTLHRFALTPPPDIEKRLIVRYTYRPARSLHRYQRIGTRRRSEEYVTFRRRFFRSRDSRVHVCMCKRSKRLSVRLSVKFLFPMDDVYASLVAHFRVFRYNRPSTGLFVLPFVERAGTSTMFGVINNTRETIAACKTVFERSGATRYNIITGLCLPVEG